jgi:hypothetical protein
MGARWHTLYCFEAPMMDDVINALTSAADEEAWEKAGLFNLPATLINSAHQSPRELLTLDSTLLLVTNSHYGKGDAPFVKFDVGCFAHTPSVRADATRGYKLPDCVSTPSLGGANVVAPNPAP